MESTEEKNAVIVVLGDIGRSPRMCYHALSLATHGFNVEMVGYLDSKPHERILSNPQIQLVGVRPPPDISLVFRPLSLILKMIWLFFTTFYAVFCETRSPASLVLVQNPPGLPTLMICYLAARWKGATFNIDWHNYTFSMLQANYAESVGIGHRKKSGFVRLRIYLMSWMINLAHMWEGFWGRHANWNLCVSRAMRSDLNERWKIHALTLYDKAPSWIFRPMNMEERHYFLIKLFSQPQFSSAIRCLENYSGNLHNHSEEAPDSSESSIFSLRNPLTGKVEMLPTRPLLIVSSTSWSLDEDFNILFEALKEYERYSLESEDEELPNLLVVITGKGPLRDEYALKFAKFHGPNVQVLLVWLAAEDYPKILASADLGISLHTSTSGLDLPMKVVDMFGCHLPVLAKSFRAIDELVSADMNGALFDTAHDLKRILVEVAKGFPNNNDKLQRWRAHFGSHLQAQSWEQQWDATFWPLVRDTLHKQAVPSEQQRRWERYSATTPLEENDNN